MKVAIAEVELSAQKPPGHPHMCQYTCHQEEEIKQRRGKNKPPKHSSNAKETKQQMKSYGRSECKEEKVPTEPPASSISNTNRQHHAILNFFFFFFKNPPKKNCSRKNDKQHRKKRRKKKNFFSQQLEWKKKKKSNNNGDKQRQMQPLLLGYWDVGISAAAGGRRVGCRESKLILQQMNERALNPSFFTTNTRTITIIVVMVMSLLIIIVTVLNIYHEHSKHGS